MRIRDAVSGDIYFNDLEEYCIRHPSFQRLHSIKQLGNAFQVYPSAMHTRFEHSLGVSHQMKKLLQQPSFFPPEYSIDNHKKDLLGLAGLLHDIVHTPFKHTLDRDSGVLPEPELKAEYNYRFEQINLKNKIGETDINILLDILATKDPFDLDEPYLHQMIEDTISADLLDYSRRDGYYSAGWGKQWDERIYDHIAISYYNGKPHLVAKLTDIKGRVTPSAITELVNLLQIRYTLNERVYLYPTKIAADSLLVKSIRSLILNTGINPTKLVKDIREMSDEGIINYLATCDNDETKLYAEHLKKRILPGLACAFKHNELTLHEQAGIASCCRGYENLEKWKMSEAQIEKEAKVEPGSIIIYCHDIEMQKKEPDFLVYYDISQEPQPVENNQEMRDEIMAIGNKHKNLWRCYIFCYDRDPEAIKRIKNVSNRILKNL